MHPYEMGVILRQRRKEESIKLRYGSLYTVIDFLLKQGQIVARETARDGRRPERTVYELTAAGAEQLHAWMSDLLAQPVKEYPQFEAALCLLPVLPPDEALVLLRQRLHVLEQNTALLAGQIEGMSAQDFPPLFVVETEYRLTLLKAEQAFVADLVRRIEEGWGPLELWRGFHDNREETLEKLYRRYGGGPMT
jgi:DNA-binding PadR family transcriptional regulator